MVKKNWKTKDLEMKDKMKLKDTKIQGGIGRETLERNGFSFLTNKNKKKCWVQKKMSMIKKRIKLEEMEL